MSEQSRLHSFAAKYESGEIPWDDHDPPPELMDLAARLEPGRALDLGSGYGRTSLYLAARGWRVEGVDFVPQAVAESHARAQIAGVSARLRFHLHDVTELSFLEPAFDLAVDIGCMHSFALDELVRYRDGLRRLIRENGYYLLFAHLRDAEDESEEAARWIEEATILRLFSDGFELEDLQHGITEVQGKPPWPSAWFWFRRART